MATTTFDGLLDWHLKHGSHGFPGDDGGTCINEAAVVVAGFAYREVTTVTDLPESFCPVISQFCLTLNDSMPEGEILNRLRPFAVRLSGSSDTRKIAFQRARHLAMRAAQFFASLAIGSVDAKAARRLVRAASHDDALAILDDLVANGSSTDKPYHGWPDGAAKSLGAARLALAKALSEQQAIYVAELAAISAIRAAAINPAAWDLAIDTIESVLAIGRRADPIESSLIDQRAKEALAAVC